MTIMEKLFERFSPKLMQCLCDILVRTILVCSFSFF